MTALARQLEVLRQRQGATPGRILEMAPALMELPMTSSAMSVLSLAEDRRHEAAFEVLQCASQNSDRFNEDFRRVIRATLNLDGTYGLLSAREEAIKGVGRIPSSNAAYLGFRADAYQGLASYLTAVPAFPCAPNGRFVPASTGADTHPAQRLAETLEIAKKVFALQSMGDMMNPPPPADVHRRLMRELFDQLPGALGAFEVAHPGRDPFSQAAWTSVLSEVVHKVYGVWERAANEIFPHLNFGIANELSGFLFEGRWIDEWRDSIRLLAVAMVDVGWRADWQDVLDPKVPRYRSRERLSETRVNRELRDSRMFAAAN